MNAYVKKNRGKSKDQFYHLTLETPMFQTHIEENPGTNSTTLLHKSLCSKNAQRKVQGPILPPYLINGYVPKTHRGKSRDQFYLLTS